MKRSAKKSLAMVLASVLMLSTVFNGIPASASTPAPTGEPEASVESSWVQAEPTSEATMTPYDPPVITPYTEIDISDSGGSDDAKAHIKDQGAEDELPLSVGEIRSIQSDDATFTICLDEDEAARLMSREKVEITEDADEDEEEEGGILSGIGSFFGGILDFFFPSMEAKAASDKMKVSYDGYASFCGHRTAVKFISESGNYHNHLVYCLNIGKNSTSGDVNSGSRVPAKILFCLVNGARKLGETCHTEKYSSGNALEDYFITSAAIHVLNGEVGLSYYDDGSGTFNKIKKLVEDAKNLDKSEYNTSGRTTISITYDITPKKTEWEEISPGLYRSKQKFVREKSGNIDGVTYTISGAPNGLTTGEINKSASDISDEEDLRRFDICIAQTDKDKPSANFYVYANSEAMTKIQAQNSVIKIIAKPTSEEGVGRQWTPTVVSQQKITFLEKMIVKNLSRTVKILGSPVDQGAISIKKLSATDGAPIPGATYGLYEDADCEEEVCQMSVTDPTLGIYTSEVFDLTQSTYYIKELDAPEGYELDEQVYEVDESYFTIYEADGTTVKREGKVFSHNEIPEKVTVAINKVDEETHLPVTGAKFAIFNDEACTTRTLIDETQSTTEVVPEFGYDEDLEAYVSAPFSKTQETYYIKETEVPPGYMDPGRVWEVKPAYGELVSITMTNTPARCTVRLKKQEKDTGDKPQGDGVLVGALYGLYAKTDIKKPGGTEIMHYSSADPIECVKGTDFQMMDVDATAGALIATAKVGTDLTIELGNLYLGDYYFKEITPGEGYLIDETEHNLTGGQAASGGATEMEVISIETVKKQAFEIIKISSDGDSKEADVVKGAEFTVKLKSEIDRLGWEAATTYDTLVTDDKGYALSKELPYGTYIVRETKTPPDLYKIDDFTVVVSEDSRTPQAWRTFNDAPFTAYIRMIKKDVETGETVLLPNAKFKIKDAAGNYIEQKVGDKLISEFITDETGTCTTPLKLKYGEYELVEVAAPDGYVLSTEPVKFTVTMGGAVRVKEDSEGDAIIEVEMPDKPVKASLNIIKKGEKLVGVTYDTIIDRIFTAVTGDNRSVTFKYEEKPLEGAVFNLIVDEDIFTSDHQVDEKGVRRIATFNGIALKKGVAVLSMTTDKEGKASVTGLPLGKYHIEEVKAPLGFALSDEKPAFVFTYRDQTADIVSLSKDISNVRQKLKIEVEKTESAVTGAAVSPVVSGGATGIWDTNPTGAGGSVSGSAVSGGAVSGGAASGGAVSPAASGGAVSGGAIGTVTGAATYGIIGTPVPIATETPFSGTASGGATSVTSGSAITVIPSTSESTGMPVEGAVYGLFATIDIKDYQGNVLICAGTLIDTAITGADGIGVFDADVPVGYMYYVKEIQTAPGYLMDESEYAIDFKTPDPKVHNLKAKLEVTDVPITIMVSKTDITEANEIPNAKLEILDKNDEVYAEWETDGTPHIIRGIPVGDYTLRETASPYGYLIASEVLFTVTETADILKVHMVDERIPAYLEINKTDRETSDPVGGCVFEIRDPKGNVVDRLTTDADGYAKSGFMEIGSYKSNGEFDKPFTYKVVETEAPDGYIRNDATFDVTFKYEDEPKEALCARLNVTNQPKYKKLVQTGGDYRPLALGAAAGILVGLGWYCFRRRRKGMGPRKRRWRKK